MKNLILIGIVTLIAMSACGDREKDPLLSRTFIDATVPANSNLSWIQRSDSSFVLELPIDTTFDGIADINVFIDESVTTNRSLSTSLLVLLFNKNKEYYFGHVIIERKTSGVYLRKVDQ